MKTGRPAVRIELTEQEHAELTRRRARHKGPADRQLRAEIILSCARSESSSSIAQRLGITAQTVSRWLLRFARLGLQGLNDEPRSGRPRSISDEKVQEVVDRVRQTRPDDASHWSSRRMSKATPYFTGERTAYLASLRAQASPGAHLQAVHRSCLCRQGAGYRRALPESAG